MNAQDFVRVTLLLLGAGFLVANTRILFEYVRFARRRRRAVLTWPSARPSHYRMGLAIGVVLGLVVFYKVVISGQQAFGETMMFVYYACLAPLGRRIGRGFYEDGIWADSGFVPYADVGGLSWREGEHAVSLIVMSRVRNLARRLAVPLGYYQAARRLVRDRIGQHVIQFGDSGLGLGVRDERNGA